MNARKLRDQQEKENKWTDKPRGGMDRLEPVCGSLSALEVVRAMCPIQMMRVDCYRLTCGHTVGRDAAHETLDEASYYGRPSIVCPTCSVPEFIDCKCMACPGCRPFTFSCSSCGFIVCASCVGNYCQECGTHRHE